MVVAASMEDRIAENYAGLSAKLKTAADYVADHPVEIATRSLRSIAQTSGVSPATFSRLARALNYEDYEEMREAGREAVGRQMGGFSQRARSLQTGANNEDMLQVQTAVSTDNIAYLVQNTSIEKLMAAVKALHGAKRVLLVGSMGSSGIIDFFGFQAQWFKQDWLVAGRDGVSAAVALSRLRPSDAILVLSKAPYAHRSMKALGEARAKGVTTVVLTDSHASPVMQFADHVFVVPSGSQNFFPSYIATLVLLDTILAMLVSLEGDIAQTRIKEAEDQVRRLGENWSN